MKGGFYDIIPGLAKAEDDFVLGQTEAFLNVEPLICGKIKLLPFTAQMFIELDAADSPFFRPDSSPAPEHVAMFLWRCSPEFSRYKWYSTWKMNRFIKRVAHIPYGQAVVEITEYLERAYAPLPAVKRKVTATRSFASWPSHLVHAFASEYGWSEETILNLPLRRLYQYMNRIIESNDPDFKQMCPATAKLKHAWMKERRIKREQAAQANK